MQIEKHVAALKEVKKSIDEALRDTDGLLARQRLLTAALSLGMQHLVELWLHKLGAIKPGAVIKHDWLASEEKRLKIRLAGALTKKIDDLKNSDKIFAFAREIERDRNDIIYGAPLIKDSVLREKIESFLELKKAVEEAIGESIW